MGKPETVEMFRLFLWQQISKQTQTSVWNSGTVKIRLCVCVCVLGSPPGSWFGPLSIVLSSVSALSPPAQPCFAAISCEHQRRSKLLGDDMFSEHLC